MARAPRLDPWLEVLRRQTAALPGAEEYVMVHHPAFRVGKKPFAILGMDHAPTLSINLGVVTQQELLDDARFTRTHYIGQHGWVTVDAGELTRAELRELVLASYRRVATTKQLVELDGTTQAKARGTMANEKTAKKALEKAPTKTAAKKARAGRK